MPYVDDPSAAIAEARRVLELGGKAIVCVPDSRRLAWKILGFAYNRLPNVKSSNQKAHHRFTRISLVEKMANRGFRALKYRYICGAELAIAFQKVE